ncbi:sugar O-acetyltransferase [bacterium]|nr:sugar O-acetyltransferase [bacterium]
MSEREKMMNGELYNPADNELVINRLHAKSLCLKYNSLPLTAISEKREILRKLLAKYGNNSHIEPNFFCDYGYNIEFEGFVYINHNSVFLDCAKIKIGNNTFIGPNCGFYTAEHPIKVQDRIKGLEIARPITIGEEVWIGGGVNILAGVTIGDRTVIGAGSVVTHDIPSDCVAVGNPCRVIKKIEN